MSTMEYPCLLGWPRPTRRLDFTRRGSRQSVRCILHYRSAQTVVEWACACCDVHFEFLPMTHNEVEKDFLFVRAELSKVMVFQAVWIESMTLHCHCGLLTLVWQYSSFIFS